MTDTETKLADALRACLPYVLHFKRRAKREADAGGLEHFVAKCEALLAAHDTARAQPAKEALLNMANAVRDTRLAKENE